MIDHDTDSYQKIARAFVDKRPSGNLTQNIVDNITLYWLTGTGASAARSYWKEGQRIRARLARLPRRSQFRSASPPSPGRSGGPSGWVERAYPDVIYFNEVDKGGHFAAWEEPDLFRPNFGRLPPASIAQEFDGKLASAARSRTLGDELGSAADPLEGRLLVDRFVEIVPGRRSEGSRRADG